MDIRRLEAFRAVVSNNSVTKAAQVLGVSQPAVSAQLARLEDEIGFSLFERRGGRLAMTAEGRQFHDATEHALQMIDQLDGVARSIRDGAAGRIVVASHPSASTSMLPPIAAAFLRDRPGTQIKMINRSSEEVRSFFPAASIDIGIAEMPIDISGVHVRRYSLPCVAILPADHRLSQKKELSAKDLSGEPFLAMPPERLISHRVRAAFVDGESEYNPIAEVDFFSSIAAMVAAGHGVSVVDRWTAEMFQPVGLVPKPFLPAIPYEIGVFTSSDRPVSALATSFLSCIHDQFTRTKDT